MTNKQNESIQGFGDIEDEESALNAKKKTKKKTGGFQAMGLSYDVLKGITKRGYKIPTPIQRKTIPLILEGRDIVAMAKTGSGKTACFLIPLFEKLKQRDGSSGARALILSPTRELAVQTFKFFKELGKHLNLKAALVLGGDSMTNQFSAMHTNPDLIVATPGRFLHLCIEMDLKLNSIQYVVFDEADRLFEMGFGEQLTETLSRLPEAKQMVMFSATLPKLLVDFAKAGLSDPVLIRLDVESKLPEGLQLKFVYCRPDERYATMVSLLKYVIPSDAQTVVFAATQHHVDLISCILTEVNVSNSLIYSTMDPSARKINLAKFQLKKVSVLVVTDIAARGIDIPSLDYVINVHFPGKPKLFVHRVGRCARAGRHGTAFSIFSSDDEAHFLDLHLFLNRPFDINDRSSIGIVPQDFLEEEHAKVLQFLSNQHISGVYRTSTNAYKKYISTRPVASVDSNKRVKLIKFTALSALNDFIPDEEKDTKTVLKDEFISKMRNYRPSGTVFELNPTQKSISYQIMKEKRAVHGKIIEQFQKKIEQIDHDSGSVEHLAESTENDIESTFNKVVMPKKRNTMEDLYKKKPKKPKIVKKDDEHYVPYSSSDKHTEAGFAVNSFERQARQAELTITDKVEQQFKPGAKKWDRIRKKMVSVEDPRAGRIKTESGIWIPATYNTGRYNDWKEKTKIEEQVHRDLGLDFDTNAKKHLSKWARHNDKQEMKKIRSKPRNSELKNPDQIVKQRMRLELIKKKQQTNTIKRTANRKRHVKKQRQKSKK